jgi:hypothetical protein
MSYTILLEDLLGINKWSQKHGRSYVFAMTTGPLIHGNYHCPNRDPKLSTMYFNPLVSAQIFDDFHLFLR